MEDSVAKVTGDGGDGLRGGGLVWREILAKREEEEQNRNGLNHHILEKMCDVTPVTDGGMKVENRVVFW